MINEGLKPLGYQQITSLSSAVALTVPAGTSLVLVSPQSQAVRWRDDGVDPSATVGYPLSVGSELNYDGAFAGGLKFIEQVASATINVLYYGRQ